MVGAIYSLMRLILRVALTVYFSRIELEGEEEVPSGPIVIAATHPNAFIDVVLVATRLSRRVHFVAKAALFKNPIGRAFLTALGAVPVERRMDRDGAALEVGAQEKNKQSLAACEEVVAKGGAVLIFPEGTSEQVPRLLPLKTGVARIALGAEARRPEGGVSVVPVALLYDDPTSFRSRARVRFLPPIPVAPFREAPGDDDHARARALTAAVRDALEPSVVHLEDGGLAKLVSEIDEVYGRQLGGARLATAPAIAQAVNVFAKSSPDRVGRVREDLSRYREALAKAGIDDETVRPRPSVPRPARAVGLLLGAPVALWGILHHFIPYQVPRVVVSLFVRDRTFVSTIKLISGTLAFLALYVGEGLLAGHYLGPWVGLGLALSLPISGIVAIDEIETWRAWRKSLGRKKRRARIPRETLRELETLRESLIRDLDRARAEFLLSRGDPVEEGLA